MARLRSGYAVKPRNRLPPVPEIRTHLAIVELLHRTVGRNPDWAWAHYPSGGKRDPQTARLMKDMGQKSGWPDFMFIHRLGHIYFLELKSVDGWLSPEQSAFHRHMRTFENVECAVARSWDEAVHHLGRWGVVPVSVTA